MQVLQKLLERKTVPGGGYNNTNNTTTREWSKKARFYQRLMTDEELAGFAVALIALITYLSLLRELRATIPESIISPSR